MSFWHCALSTNVLCLSAFHSHWNWRHCVFSSTVIYICSIQFKLDWQHMYNMNAKRGLETRLRGIRSFFFRCMRACISMWHRMFWVFQQDKRSSVRYAISTLYTHIYAEQTKQARSVFAWLKYSHSRPSYVRMCEHTYTLVYVCRAMRFEAVLYARWSNTMTTIHLSCTLEHTLIRTSTSESKYNQNWTENSITHQVLLYTQIHNLSHSLLATVLCKWMWVYVCVCVFGFVCEICADYIFS